MKPVVTIRKYEALGLITCKTDLLSFEDFKKLAKILCKRLGVSISASEGVSGYKLGQVKDGFYIWLTDSDFHKGILAVGVAIKLLVTYYPKYFKEHVSIRKFIPVIVKAFSTFKKGPENPEITLSQLVSHLQKSAKVMQAVCAIINNSLSKLIDQKEVEKLRSELIERGAINNRGSIVSFDRYIDVLCEGMDEERIFYYLSSDRLCVVCGKRFTPVKGSWALFCPTCRMGPKKVMKMRICRHYKRSEIQKYLTRLKKSFDISEQRAIISELHKRFSRLFKGLL